MKHRAFSLIELLIVLLILSITAMVTSLNMNKFTEQTARNDAEKAAAFINNKIHRAAMKGVGFRLTVNDDSLASEYGLDDDNMTSEEALNAGKGCSFALYAKSGTSYGTSTKNKLYCNVNGSSVSIRNWYKISDDCFARTSTQEEGEYYIKVSDSAGNFCNVIIAR